MKDLTKHAMSAQLTSQRWLDIRSRLHYLRLHVLVWPECSTTMHTQGTRECKVQGLHLYNVEILAREGANQFCVRVRAILLLPSTQWWSGTVLSSCRKLRRSPNDLNAAGVTTKLRRSLDWKETFCRLLVWR